MGLERRFSANRVASAAIGGSFSIIALLVALSLPISYAFNVYANGKPSHALLMFELVLFVLLLLAGVFTWKAVQVFKDGVNGEVWDQTSLHALRDEIERPIWSVLGCLLIIGVVVLLFYNATQIPVHGHQRSMNTGGFVYFWISPFIVLQNIRTALRPKKLDVDVVRFNMRKPLSSEHWGKR